MDSAKLKQAKGREQAKPKSIREANLQGSQGKPLTLILFSILRSLSSPCL